MNIGCELVSRVPVRKDRSSIRTIMLYVLILVSVFRDCELAEGVVMERLGNGVVFHKLKSVIYTAASYSVNIKFDLNILVEQDEAVEKEFQLMFSYLGKMMQDQGVKSLVTELSLLHTELTGYEAEMAALLRLIPSGRRTRSICDGLGRVISSVTGLLDDQVGTQVMGNIGKLQMDTENLKLEASTRKLVIKNILEETCNNTLMLNSVVKELASGLNQVDELSRVQLVIQKIGVLSFWVSKIRYERGTLRQGLEKAFKGSLSSDLLPPSKLERVVKEIERVLVAPVSLIVPGNFEELGTVYELSRVKIKARGSTLIVNIEIPLKEGDSEFQLIKILTVPVFSDILGHFVKYSLGEFLLVSPDLKNYAVVDRDLISLCEKSRNLTVCPAQAPIYRSDENNCEFGLYCSLKPTLCKKEIIKEFSGVFSKIGTGWVFSVPQPVKINVNCDNQHEFKTIRGAGIIRNEQECEIMTDTQTLPGGKVIFGELAEDWSDMVIPLGGGGESLLNSGEVKRLEQFKVNENLAESVHLNLEKVRGTMEVSEMLDMLGSDRDHCQLIPVQAHLYGLSITVLVVVVILCVLGLRVVSFVTNTVKLRDVTV